MKNVENKRKCLSDPTHKVYFDKKEKRWICKNHEEGYTKDGTRPEIAKGWADLEFINKGFLLNNIEYNKGAEPLDRRKKIDNESLRDIFVERLEGKTLKVSILKQYFEGTLKINDKDTSTTVISSSIMRRLGRLTGKKWHQERLKGITDNEPLVKFTMGPEKYKTPKQLKQEKINLHNAEKKVLEEISELVEEKGNTEMGFYMDDDGELQSDYLDDKERAENLEYYKAEIRRLEKLLGSKEEEKE